MASYRLRRADCYHVGTPPGIMRPQERPTMPLSMSIIDLRSVQVADLAPQYAVDGDYRERCGVGATSVQE